MIATMNNQDDQMLELVATAEAARKADIITPDELSEIRSLYRLGEKIDSLAVAKSKAVQLVRGMMDYKTRAK